MDGFYFATRLVRRDRVDADSVDPRKTVRGSGCNRVRVQYRVKITKFEVESDWTPEHDEGVRPKETSTMGLPAKYAGFESSGLTADVIEETENEFQFELN
jgi:hypothetical protein